MKWFVIHLFPEDVEISFDTLEQAQKFVKRYPKEPYTIVCDPVEFLKQLRKKYEGIPASADSVDYYQHYNIQEWIDELEGSN